MLVSQNFKNKILNIYNSGKYLTVEEDATYLLSKGFTDPWLCNLLAVSLAKQKKYSQAIKYFEILCDLNPENFNNYFNLGNLYRDAKQSDLAMKYYLISINKNPKHLESITEISKIFYRIKDFENALKYAFKAKKIQPHSYEVIDLFGQIYFLKGDFIKSKSEYEKLRDYEYKKDKVNTNIASNLIQLGETDQAIKILEKNPLDKAKYNLGVIYLSQKKFSKGWDNYNIGLDIGERYLRVSLDKLKILSKWRPQKNFKSVLIIGEQGLGDELMFSLLLKKLNLSETKIGLLFDKRLKNLFASSDLNHEFIESFDEALEKKYESYISIGSLCKYFIKSESDFSKLPNLNIRTNKKLISDLKSKLVHKFTIGISWHTSNKQLGSLRNIKLKQFLPLFLELNANFINLQYGDHISEIAKVSRKIKKDVFIKDNIDNKADLDSFAAKVSVCDLILSIDNSTVHLAGILNKNTIAFIPEVSDWRWFGKNDKCLWYQNTTLIRKSKSWDPAIKDAILYCKNLIN